MHREKPLPFVPAFGPLTTSSADLEDLPTPTVFKHHSQLIQESETPRWVGRVRSGILKLSHMDEDGREVIIGLRSTGWWLNAGLAVLGLPSVYTITAITDCSIFLFNLSDWNERVKSHPNLLHEVFYSQSQELIMLQKHVILREASAEHRLRHLEAEATDSIWKTVNPNQVMNHGELAGLLSVSSEHLSRIKSKRALLARKKAMSQDVQ